MYLDDKTFGEPPVIGDAPLEPWRQVLELAADYMETHGHTKHVLKDSLTGAVCIRGAIREALGARTCGGYDTLTPENKVVEYLGLPSKPVSASFGDYYVSETGQATVVAWNNAPERKGEEVVAAMRGAARS